MISPEFSLKNFHFCIYLITFGFLLKNRMKNYSFYKVGALLLLQLLPVFIIDVLLILFFNIDYKEMIYQIVFVILPYTTVMFIFSLQRLNNQ